jgi:steroid delta-isomerase-like uncharacterized protein
MNPKEFVTNYMMQAWNERDPSVITRTFLPDAKIHSSSEDLIGAEEMVATVESWLAAFPDLQVTIQEIVQENGMVVAMWSATGTHKGALRELQPTGLTAQYRGVTIHRVQDNKIAEYWAYVDMRAFLEEACKMQPTI